MPSRYTPYPIFGEAGAWVVYPLLFDRARILPEGGGGGCWDYDDWAAAERLVCGEDDEPTGR